MILIVAAIFGALGGAIGAVVIGRILRSPRPRTVHSPMPKGVADAIAARDVKRRELAARPMEGTKE